MAIALGMLLLAIALIRFIVEQRGIGLIAPAATIIATGLASFAAIIGIETWAEKHDEDRQRAEYKNREEVYGEMAQIMLSRFPNSDDDATPYDKKRDRELRAIAALWASSEVITTLGCWQAQLSEIMKAHQVTSGSIALTEHQQTLIRRRFGDCVAAMRRDLSSGNGQAVSSEAILASIFNS